MPLLGLKNELSSGDLKIIPVKGLPIDTRLSLISLQNKKFLPPAKVFLKYLAANKKTLIENHFSWYDKEVL
jgi:hypothetical protein